jgi:hypothetical protein
MKFEMFPDIHFLILNVRAYDDSGVLRATAGISMTIPSSTGSHRHLFLFPTA